MNVRIDLLHGPHSMVGTLFSVIDMLRTFNNLWQMRNPDKRGAFFHWRLIDASGNELPRYHYRLLGKSGQSFQGRTDPSGRTQPLPDSAHPPLEVQFPERKW